MYKNLGSTFRTAKERKEGRKRGLRLEKDGERHIGKEIEEKERGEGERRGERDEEEEERKSDYEYFCIYFRLFFSTK